MAVLLASEPARDKIETVRIHKTFATRHTIAKILWLNGKIYLADFSAIFFFFVSHNAQNLVKLSKIQSFSSATRW